MIQYELSFSCAKNAFCNLGGETGKKGHLKLKGKLRQNK